MRTVTVSSIVTNAASRAGLDGSPSTRCRPPPRRSWSTTFRQHLRDAWEFYDWPDLTRTEERTVQTGVDEDIYIDLAQASETEIGDVFSVYQDNPHTHAAPREISFSLDLDKIRLPSDCPDTIYVKFRLPAHGHIHRPRHGPRADRPADPGRLPQVLPHRRPPDRRRPARQGPGHVWPGRVVARQGDREIHLPAKANPPMDRAGLTLLTLNSKPSTLN
jgi:hypothetical protein